jgi:hypothetical protein
MMGHAAHLPRLRAHFRDASDDQHAMPAVPQVINIATRGSRLATTPATLDDTSEHWGPLLLAGALAVGGGAALWHGVKVRQASVTTPGEFRKRPASPVFGGFSGRPCPGQGQQSR